jgi:hypothetical protein
MIDGYPRHLQMKYYRYCLCLLRRYVAVPISASEVSPLRRRTAQWIMWHFWMVRKGGKIYQKQQAPAPMYTEATGDTLIQEHLNHLISSWDEHIQRIHSLSRY